MLPVATGRRILDIGCGSGVPSLELARLGGGIVVCIDTDQRLLDRLSRRARERGLVDRIEILNQSMFGLDFPDDEFDIIWAEGSIAAIGFQKGLTTWRRFLKSRGFLVVHDDADSTSEKLALPAACGYRLIDHFTLDENVWWHEYYRLLEKLVRRFRAERRDNPEAEEISKADLRQIEMYKQNPSRFRSVFIIMQKS